MPDSKRRVDRTRVARWMRVGVVLLLVAGTALTDSTSPVRSARAELAGSGGSNKDLAPDCGLKVTLILDESYSIASPTNYESSVQGAVRSFAQALIVADPTSQVRLIEFDQIGRDVRLGGANTGFQPVNAVWTAGATPGSSNAINAYLNGREPHGANDAQDASVYDPTGSGKSFTNWESALWRAQPPGDGGPAGGHGPGDLVIFVTDGVPNTVGTSTGTLEPGNTNQLWKQAWDAAVPRLGAIQGEAHVVGVGVGAASSVVNFGSIASVVERQASIQVAGGTAAPDPANRNRYSNVLGTSFSYTQQSMVQLATVDAINAGAFSNLGASLATIARGACPKNITVTKHTTATPEGAPVPTPWAFGFTLTRNGQPVAAYDDDTTADHDGPAVRWEGLTPGSYVLSENPLPHGSPWSQGKLTCTGWPAGVSHTTKGAGVTFTIPDGPGSPTTIDIACEITNTYTAPPPKVSLVKNAGPDFQEPGSPDPGVVYGLTVGNPGAVPITITGLVDRIWLGIVTADAVDLDLGTAAAGATVPNVGGTLTANTCPALIGTPLAPGAEAACTFTIDYAGRTEGEVVNDRATVTAEDALGREVHDKATADVAVTGARPTVQVQKFNADFPVIVPAPGGVISYDVVVTNPADAVEAIKIVSFTDQMSVGGAEFGGVLDITTVSAAIPSTTCDLLVDVSSPTWLDPGESANCRFEVDTRDLGVLAAGEQLVNTVTVDVVDDDGDPATDTHAADRPVVEYTPTLGLWKSDGQATIDEPRSEITYTVWIDNLGVKGVNPPLTITTITDTIEFRATGASAPGDPRGVLTIQAPTEADPDGIAYELTGGVTFVGTTCDALIGTTLEPWDQAAHPAAFPDRVAGDVEFLDRPGDPGSRSECTITLGLPGVDGNWYHDVVKATAVDTSVVPNRTETAENSATTPVYGPPSVLLVKEVKRSAEPDSAYDESTTVAEPGGAVTFRFTITNTSGAGDPLVLQQLTDSSYGDLFGTPNPGAATTCGALQDTTLLPGASVTCTVTATVSGSVGGLGHTNIATVGAVDDEGTPVTDTDEAHVGVDNALPQLQILKTHNAPDGVNEPGETVTFTFEITNLSGPSDPVTLTSLDDTVFGLLFGAGYDADALHPGLSFDGCADALAGVVLAPGASIDCSVDFFVAGNAGFLHANEVTVHGEDDEHTPVSDTDTAEVPVHDVAPEITVLKTAVAYGPDATTATEVTPAGSTPVVPSTGAYVRFRIDVALVTTAETVTLTDLFDDVYDLFPLAANSAGEGTGTIASTDCAEGGTIATGATYTCHFVAWVAGTAGGQHVDTVTGTVTDDEGGSASDDDDAVVEFAPPGAYALTITKLNDLDGDPTDTDTVGPGDAWNWILLVTNSGDEPVTNPVVGDSLPAGVALDGPATDIVVEALTGTDWAAAAGWTPTYDAATRTVEVTAAALAAGGQVRITIPVVSTLPGHPAVPQIVGSAQRPTLAAPGTLVNTATVDSDQTPPDDDTDVVEQFDARVWVECVNDAPYLGFVVQTSPGAVGDTRLTWSNGHAGAGNTVALGGGLTGGPAITPALGAAGIVAGTTYLVDWPGAVWNMSGIGVDWPGWRPLTKADYHADGSLAYDPDGDGVADPGLTWNGWAVDSPTDSSDYWWRFGSEYTGDEAAFLSSPASTTVTFEFNPEVTIAEVEYPADSPACAVDRNAEVTIDKQVEGSATRAPGETFDYTLAVTNHDGRGAAWPVVVTDTVPDGLVLQSVTAGANAVNDWNCGTAGATVTCTLLGPLQPSATAPPIAVTVTVDPGLAADLAASAGPIEIVNTGTVTYDWFDQTPPAGDDEYPGPFTDTDDAPVDIVDHGIDIEKTASAPFGPNADDTPGLAPGESMIYTLLVTNTGVVTATDVVVTDAIPGRLRVNSVASSAGVPSVSGQNVRVAIPSLAPNATVTITVNVTLLPGVSAEVPGVGIPVDGPQPEWQVDPLVALPNTACVAAEFGDGRTDDDCDTVTTPVDDIVALLYPLCVNGAPLLAYRIATTPSLADLPVTLRWTPDVPRANTSPAEVALTLPANSSGVLPWPGAQFTSTPGDPSGVSVGWPGWRPIVAGDYVDGSLDHIDPDDLWMGYILDPDEPDYAWRFASTVTLTINPTLTFAIEAYPRQTDACVPARDTTLEIDKHVIGSTTLNAGATFRYGIEVSNVSEIGGAAAVVLTDAIPSDIAVEAIHTSTTAYPRWVNCAVTGRRAGGYGGTLRCELLGTLLPTAAAPLITLDARVNPNTTQTRIVNVAVARYELAGDPTVTGEVADDARIDVIVVQSAPPSPPQTPTDLPNTGSSVPTHALRLASLLTAVGLGLRAIAWRRRAPRSAADPA